MNRQSLRAIELDPTFALAYAGMSLSYSDLNQAGLAAENATKAYELPGSSDWAREISHIDHLLPCCHGRTRKGD